MKHHRHSIRLIATALLVASLAAACGRSTIVDDVRVKSHNVWNRYTPEVFEREVKQDDAYYNIDFSVEIDTLRFRYDNMPFVVDMYGPQGEHRMFYTDIPLKEQGRWRGEMRGAYRHFDQRIRAYFSFNDKGTHRLEVKQGTSQYDLEGIHSFGVYVERTRLDYDKL